MYNRYIPQPDGSYRRSNQPDRPLPRPEAPRAPVKQEPLPCPSAEQPAPPRQECPERKPQIHKSQNQSISQFFRQLLPKNFDTADLLIVLLLLLMAGDDLDEQNYALLTLALYLFM